MADLNRTIDRATTISRDVAVLLDRRGKEAWAAYRERVQKAHGDYLQPRVAKAPWELWQDAADYAGDAIQRLALFWDTLRQRGNNHIEHERARKPPLLAYKRPGNPLDRQ